MNSRVHAAPGSELALADQEPMLRAAGTRRALLGAAGGFALAASGIFLPAWLDETEAREGALGGEKGGRRGKNHRGRHRRRRHGDKKDRQKHQQPRGGVPTKSIAFIVHNFRPVAVQVQGWDTNQDRDAYIVPSGWDWTTLAALPAAGPALPATREFFGNSFEVTIRIDTTRIVNALNHGTRPFRNGELPDVTIGKGGWDSKGWNPRGVVRTEADPLDSGRSISADGIKVTRIDDSPSHLRFTIDLT